MKFNFKKIALVMLIVTVLACMMSVSAFAAGTGDVAGAVEDTWVEARGQIKDVVNNVIFPVIDLILAVLFFVKVATAYLDYRKHDEILAFVLFLIADSDLVAYATETGEVEFDDLANLINHMANRAKFLLMCLRDNRYDILNLVVQYARKEKSDQIDTLFCFDTVEPDDGGVIGYYRTLTDKDAYYEKYGDGCIPAFAGKERMRDLGLSDDEDDDYEDDDYEDDDYEDESEDELDEPLVERDFEG